MQGTARETKWIDDKIDDERWGELRARFDAEREQARTAIRTADATLGALAEPDDAHLIRAEVDESATDKQGLRRTIAARAGIGA